MADSLAAHHAEADRLLAAHDADGPLASRLGAVTLGAIRALRAERTDDLNDEWRAYLERRGAVAVYSQLLTVGRAGMWPDRYVTPANGALPNSPATACPGAPAAELRWGEADLCSEQLQWAARYAQSTRRFAIVPFDGHADTVLWLIRTRSSVRALTVARYEDVLAIDIAPVDETHLARGVVHAFGDETPTACDSVAA